MNCSKLDGFEEASRSIRSVLVVLVRSSLWVLGLQLNVAFIFLMISVSRQMYKVSEAEKSRCAFLSLELWA